MLQNGAENEEPWNEGLDWCNRGYYVWVWGKGNLILLFSCSAGGEMCRGEDRGDFIGNKNNVKVVGGWRD